MKVFKRFLNYQKYASYLTSSYYTFTCSFIIPHCISVYQPTINGKSFPKVLNDNKSWCTGAQALVAHQHAFCSHLNTRFKQKFRPKYT